MNIFQKIMELTILNVIILMKEELEIVVNVNIIILLYYVFNAKILLF